MTIYTGWLLDLYEDPLGGLVLWFLDDDGKRRRLRQRFPVIFYAAGPAALQRAFAAWLEKQPVPARCWMDRRMDVFAGEEIPVLAIEVQRPCDAGTLYRQASRAFPGLTFSDADLQIALRYAAASGVSLLGRCRVTLDTAAGMGDFVQSITALDSPWDLDPHNPPLRVLSLEPDCDPVHAVPRALHVQAGGESFSLALAPARPLLVSLRALLADYDPDLLLTSWGDTWLLPRLLGMAEERGLSLPLNRDADAVTGYRKERWYFSYGQIVYRGEQVHLFGRWHVDRRNAMMWSDYELDGILETARVTGLPLQTAARVSPGTGISSIQMQTALRLGILVPCQKQQVEELKPAWDLFAADQGGLVYQPIVGVHRNVAEIDFVSMYPAIMVYCNISPETIGRAAGPQADNVPALRLIIDRDREGLVPRALRPLLEKRVALKQRLTEMPAWDERRRCDKSRASALKWLLVTCFGYLGYKNARFGRIEAHQAVTAFGREALLRAKETAEDRGFTVLHLYVDALWVCAEGKSRPADLKDLLAEIQERSGLPIALDGIYRWVVFLASRQNASRPVANRYFGVFQSGEIKARGIAARRRDTPPFIARVQGELIECLARAPEPEDALPQALALLHRRLADLSAASRPFSRPGVRGMALEDLLVSQRITRAIEEYRSPSPAARAARQLRQMGKEIKPGQRVRFLFTLGRPGVYAWDLPARPNPASVDVPRYRELLLRAAREVLEPFLGEMNQGEIASNNCTYFQCRAAGA
jgi:DNA polymerase-2